MSATLSPKAVALGLRNLEWKILLIAPLALAVPLLSLVHPEWEKWFMLISLTVSSITAALLGYSARHLKVDAESHLVKQAEDIKLMFREGSAKYLAEERESHKETIRHLNCLRTCTLLAQILQNEVKAKVRVSIFIVRGNTGSHRYTLYLSTDPNIVREAKQRNFFFDYEDSAVFISRTCPKETVYVDNDIQRRPFNVSNLDDWLPRHGSCLVAPIIDKSRAKQTSPLAGFIAADCSKRDAFNRKEYLPMMKMLAEEISLLFFTSHTWSDLILKDDQLEPETVSTEKPQKTFSAHTLSKPSSRRRRKR